MRRRLASPRVVLLVALTCALWGAFCAQASAYLITFQVNGTLDAFGGPPLAPLAIGQPYSSTFVFESKAASTPVFGGGNDFIGAVRSATFSIGSYSGTLVDPTATTIRVLDNFFGNSDSYVVFLGDTMFGTPGVIDAPPVTGPLGGLNPVLFRLVSLDDFFPSLDGLSNTDLPLTPPDITKFDSARWVVEFRSADLSLFGTAGGTIQSLRVAEVPEPPSLVVFLIGLVGLGLARYRWMPRRPRATLIRG